MCIRFIIEGAEWRRRKKKVNRHAFSHEKHQAPRKPNDPPFFTMASSTGDRTKMQHAWINPAREDGGEGLIWRWDPTTWKTKKRKKRINQTQTKWKEKQVQWAVNNFPISLSLSLSVLHGERREQQHDWIRTHVVQKKRVTQSCSTTNFLG